MHNTLNKFIKNKNKLNLVLGNQRATYNKIGQGYEPKNNAKIFNNIFHNNRTSKRSMPNYNYYGKNDHNDLSCFISN